MILTIHGYSNAGWALIALTKKSISRYTFILSSSTIAWSSKKQQTVALPSTEAECMALMCQPTRYLALQIH
jgi:hypothetical protein